MVDAVVADVDAGVVAVYVVVPVDDAVVVVVVC